MFLLTACTLQEREIMRDIQLYGPVQGKQVISKHRIQARPL